MSALISLGIDTSSDQAYNEMLNKHPQAPPPNISNEPLEVEPIKVTPKEVEDGIKSFKPGTAPGPSGLRAAHLKEMIKAKSPLKANAAKEAITTFTNFIL